MKLFKIMILIFFVITKAEAQLANLPDFYNPLNVGRIVVYQSPAELTWMRPTAFSSDFNCTGGAASEFRTCYIKIFNYLNPQEMEKIDELMQKRSLKILPFSDLDSAVVSNIEESFTDLPSDISGKIMSNQSLSLIGNKFPYASLMFRVPAQRAQELLNLYQSYGLGKFKVSFLVRGQRTIEYLSLVNMSCVKSTLKSNPKFSNKKQLYSHFKVAIDQCGMSHVNFESTEAESLVMNYLKNNFYTYSFISGYKLNQIELDKVVEEKLEIINDTEAGLKQSCKSEVDLSSESKIKTNCKEA